MMMILTATSFACSSRFPTKEYLVIIVLCNMALFSSKGKALERKKQQQNKTATP